MYFADFIFYKPIVERIPYGKKDLFCAMIIIGLLSFALLVLKVEHTKLKTKIYLSVRSLHTTRS
jgi:hypothetical protein